MPARPLWLHGVVGGLIFCLYYYAFFVLGVALLLSPLLDRWHPPVERGAMLRRVAILAVAAVVSSVYWLPLLLSTAAAPEPASMQNRWLEERHLELPVTFLGGGVIGFLMLGGLVHSAWTARREPLSAGLLLLRPRATSGTCSASC